MSRIGTKPLSIPEKVTVEVKDRVVIVKGPKGELTQELHPYVNVEVKEEGVVVTVQKPEVKAHAAMWGTFAALIRNMLQGVSEGYQKKLLIKGVGYGWKVAGQKLTVNAGYSHPVDITLPEGVTASAEKNELTLQSINKQQVGEIAANIRKVRPPEPYKGSGIQYDDEQVRRKAGKQAAGGGE